MCVCVYDVCMHVCVCVCACVWWWWLHACECVCVCVCKDLFSVPALHLCWLKNCLLRKVFLQDSCLHPHLKPILHCIQTIKDPHWSYLAEWFILTVQMNWYTARQLLLLVQLMMYFVKFATWLVFDILKDSFFFLHGRNVENLPMQICSLCWGRRHTVPSCQTSQVHCRHCSDWRNSGIFLC